MDEKQIAEIVAKAVESTTQAVSEKFEAKLQESQTEIVKLAQEMKTIAVGKDAIDDAPKHVKQALFLQGVITGDIDKMKKAYKSFDKDDALKMLQKSMSEGTGSAGGYAVPPEYRQEINRVVEEYGIARQVCRVIPTRSNIVYSIASNANVTVTVVGENTAITPADPSYAQKTHTVKGLKALTYISQELLDDAVSSPSLIADLNIQYGEALAGYEDDKFINGTAGVSPNFSGFLENPTSVVATGHVTFSAITYDDILKLYTSLSMAKRRNSVFIAHRTAQRYLLGLMDSNNRPIFTNEGIIPKLFGIPLYESEYAPSTDGTNKPFLAFGDFKKSYQFADRQQMRMSIDSSEKFGEDRTGIKVVERISIQPIFAANIAVLKTA